MHASGETRPLRLDEVERVAVVRGGGLGDVLLAAPAMRALADAHPGATVTLLTAPAHVPIVRERVDGVHDVVALPVARGVHEPAGSVPDDAAVDRFTERMRARRFDLAVQLHGGGRWSNPFTLALGARCAIGSRTPDAAALDRDVPFRFYQHTTLHSLEVARLVGASTDVLEPTVRALPGDLATADRLLASTPRPLVVAHPGATDPRRRWPHERFAEVLSALVRRGAGVVVIGAGGDAHVAVATAKATRLRVPAALRTAVRPLPGVLDASGLVGVLARAAVVLANDSGPRHLAGALGVPTVSVYWAGNVINAGPLSRARHVVHVSWTSACPVCARLAASSSDQQRCEHDVSFVTDVPAGPVLTDVEALLWP